MNIIKHTKYIWEISDIISEDEIEEVRHKFSTCNLEPIESSRNNSRRNNTFHLPYYIAMGREGVIDLNSLCNKLIAKAHKIYLEKNILLFYGYPRSRVLESWKWRGQNIIRTYDKYDHYQWHSDRIEERPSELSYIIYLNDEFEGGKTCFFNDKLGVTPRKGSVLCFPVDDYHIHKSMKITSGTKQILWNCLWYEVPQDLNDVKKVTSKPVNKGNIWG